MIPQVQESDYLYSTPKSFSTRAIHTGQHAEPIHGSVNVPIHLSTTYKQKAPGQPYSSFDYTRCGNPTRAALEECIADLENSKHCITFSSGCAAMSCIINICKHGEQIICCDDVYGGTQRYMRNFTVKNHGIEVLFVDITDPENVAKAVTEKTKLIWIETPTNPTLKIVDIAAVCKIAKENKILSVVDNTFATPYLQTPRDLGADITVNSGTKYMGGHSDVVFGSLTCNDKELYDRLFFSAKSQGGCPSVFDCYLIMRSLKTLELRVKQATKNAYIFAKYLESNPLVEKVIYPGLPSHPQHELVKRQQRGGGAMISFYVKGGFEETSKLLKALKIFTLAESLGGVESLIEVPSVMTHGSVPVDVRNQLGITDNLVRVSIGIENVEDLINDMEEALKASH
ncbi:unnamed protein product [Paramecium pentaurelia]|uniref:cystathionine gamma-lyase n=1 Tax=Paramecium pentaurelia TaxID=43138 RepID=A0A8S1WIB2_9CILI|nr:unnamed protein product [Paramecium pentaurelia]